MTTKTATLLRLGTTERGPFSLPEEALAETFFIGGIRGSGKTTAVAVMCEESRKQVLVAKTKEEVDELAEAQAGVYGDGPQKVAVEKGVSKSVQKRLAAQRYFQGSAPGRHGAVDVEGVRHRLQAGHRNTAVSLLGLLEEVLEARIERLQRRAGRAWLTSNNLVDLSGDWPDGKIELHLQ